MFRENQQTIFNRIITSNPVNPFIIIGNGESGKTFLLKKLADHYKTKNTVIFINAERYVAVDFKDGIQPFLARSIEVENSFDAINDFIEKNGDNIVLIIDEANLLSEQSQSFFRSFTQQEKIVKIIAAAREIESMLNKPYSEFVNVMTPLYL